MPGAFVHSARIAMDKAGTAAGFRFPTSAWKDVAAATRCLPGLNKRSPACDVRRRPADRRGRAASAGSASPAVRWSRTRSTPAPGSRPCRRREPARRARKGIGVKDFHNFINGEFVATGRTFEKRRPTDDAGDRPGGGGWQRRGRCRGDGGARRAQGRVGPHDHGPAHRRAARRRRREINRRFDDFRRRDRRHRQAARARLARRHPARRGQLRSSPTSSRTCPPRAS